MNSSNNLKSQLTELIAVPSVSSVNSEFDQGNAGVIALLAEWLEALGFEIELQSIPGTIDKLNLIARSGTGDDGLILAGHTDTVPYDDAGWNSDPFTLTEENDRFYGLGSSDMKGFFPLVMEAIRSFDLKKLSKPLIVVATADEESTMSGARYLVEQNRLKARYAVIGEPTGLTPIRMHKGVMMESIHVYGQSGHSSNPELGNNALEGMHRVMGELLSWRERFQQKFNDNAFDVVTPTMNLGHIHGGDNPNRICAECELQIDLRILPGMNIESLKGELNQCVSGALSDTGLTYDVRSLTDPIPPMETSAQSRLVQACERFSRREAKTVAFATEGPFLNALGIETVILGAGDIDQAHQPNEYVSLDRLKPMVSLLEQLIDEFCNKP